MLHAALRVASRPLGSVDCALSPDGSLVAYTVATWTANGPEIMSYSFASGAVAPLASAEGMDFNPAWSPRGGTLAFVSTRRGVGVWLKSVSGGAEARVWGFSSGMLFRPSWSPGGQDIAVCWDATPDGGPVVADIRSIRVDTEE